MSRSYEVEIDEGQFSASQVEVTYDESATYLQSQKVHVDHREMAGQANNLAGVDVTTNFATNDDVDHPVFNEAREHHLSCWAAD